MSKKASDYKCCACKKRPAVVFWPCIDLDIEAHPYCRVCLEKAQMEVMLKLMDEKGK